MAAIQAEMILQALFISQCPRENDEHHQQDNDCAWQ